MTTPVRLGVAVEGYVVSDLLELPCRVAQGQSASFGRDGSNTIVLPSRLVSRRHALLKRESTGFWLADRGSTNGTYVNGEPVRERMLRDGDRIAIGTFEFAFHTDLPVSQDEVERHETHIFTAPGSFSGDVSAETLLEVWQMLDLNRKTGVLEVRTGESRGLAVFSRGVPLHAEYGGLLGDEAVLKILVLDRGFFRFRSGEGVAATRTVHAASSALLFEAARRRDEAGADPVRLAA
jgi:pSer/pThr/pTyr-binding forkhead associated (FHA) protein